MRRVQEVEISYTLVSVVFVVAWMLALEFFATRDHKIIGSGSLEYKRIADATMRVFGVLAISRSSCSRRSGEDTC